MTTDEHRELMTRMRGELPPQEFLDYREYLAMAYFWLKDRLGRYSYLQYADDLGFSYTNVVHLVIRGRRALSLQAAKRVANAFAFSEDERAYFFSLCEYQNAKEPVTKELFYRRLLELRRRQPGQQGLTTAQLRMFDEWYFPIVREMASLPAFSSDPAWIAERIMPRISPEQAAASLSLLTELGLLHYDEAQGRHVPSERVVSTDHHANSLPLQQFHCRMIDLGRDALPQQESEFQDISVTTITISHIMAQDLKREIAAFRQRLVALAERSSAPPDQVYVVNIQLFPVVDAGDVESNNR